MESFSSKEKVRAVLADRRARYPGFRGHFPSFVEWVIADLSWGDPTRVAFVPRFNVRDPFLEQLGFLLMAEVARGGSQGNLYAEALAHTLVLHLLRTSSTLSAIHPLPARAFTRGERPVVRGSPVELTESGREDDDPAGKHPGTR